MDVLYPIEGLFMGRPIYVAIPSHLDTREQKLEVIRVQHGLMLALKFTYGHSIGLPREEVTDAR